MIKRWGKRVVIFIGIIAGLLIIFLVFLHTAPGKSLVRQKVVSFLEKKWGTDVSIGNIDYRLPNWILLERVNIRDRKKDSLLNVGQLFVQIRMLKLLSNTVEVSGLRLEDASLHCHREANDAAFNFQFALDAFAPAENSKNSKVNETPLRLSVNHLSLKRIRLSFNDDDAQMYLSAFIKELTIRPDALSPGKKSLEFNELTLSDTQVTLVDSSAKKEPTPRKANDDRGAGSLLLALKNLTLRNVIFAYQVPQSQIDYSFRVENLAIQQGSLDLNRRSVKVDSLWLRNTDVKLANWVTESSAGREQQAASKSNENDWSFAVQSINFDNNSFSYDNNAVPEIKGLDFQHIDLKNIHLQTQGNRFDSAGFYSGVESLSLGYNNRVYVNDIRTTIFFSDSLLLVKDLKTSINESQLTSAGVIAWPLKKGVRQRDRRFVIENSNISFGDLLLIHPALKKQLPLSLLPSDKIMLSGAFSGTSQKFQGEKINIATSNRQLFYKGNVEFGTKKGGAKIRATLQRLTVSKKILSKGLLLQLQKQNIFLPAEITLTGETQIDAKDCTAKLVLNSEFGQLLIDGKVRNISSPDRVMYNLTLDATDLKIGKWIGLEGGLGKIDGRIFIEGKGLVKNNLAATAGLQLRSAVINGYSLSDIAMQVQVDRSDFTIQSRIDDENLRSDIHLSGVAGQEFSVEGNVRIEKANLFGLGITTDTMTCAGTVSIRGTYGSPHGIDALIQLDSSEFLVSSKQFQADHVSIRCRSGTDSMSITVQAPFADIQLSGNYSATALPAELSSIWRKFSVFNTPVTEDKPGQVAANHNTWLHSRIAQGGVISAFLPGLELQQPLTLQGRFHSSNEIFFQSIQLSAPAIRYNHYEAEDLQVDVNAADSGTQFSLNAPKFVMSNKEFGNTHISGNMQKDFLAMKAITNDSLGNRIYAGHVQVKKEKDDFVIKLLDDLVFNYNTWKLSSGNSIQVSKDGYIVDSLAMENRGQVIRINSSKQSAAAPIDIRIENFDIGRLFTATSPNETLPAKGILNADISIQQPIHKIPVVTGNIEGTNLSVYDNPLGDLHFHSTNIGDSIDVQGKLSGASQVGFSGRMHLANGGITLGIHLEKFNPDIARSLTKDFLKRVTATITGELKITGTPHALQYEGAVYIDSAAFALKSLNTLYRIDKQKLSIDYPAIRFEKFVLTDSAGHPLTVLGNVNLFDRVKSIDVKIETADFIAMHSTRQPGTLLYGTAIVDAALNVKGTTVQPVIEGNAGLQAKSNVYVVSSPKRSYSKTRNDGIIFVKMDTLASAAAGFVEAFDSLSTEGSLKGVKYNLELKVDKEAEFSVLVNPATGDELVMKGDARLNVGLGKNGKAGIEGVYNLQSGYYKMNNLLLRGKFMLVKGSSISFSGSPELAEADVTTEYTIETSPKGLLNYQNEDNTDYSQRVPFAVVLTIKGPVAKPVLSFDIQLRPGKAILKSTVKSDIEHALNRLRSEVTELNKQVFSLLLAKRFSGTTADNTLESSNLNANNALKEGVSSFLTAAMDQVADQLIKNVDVDVSMKTYKADNDPVSKTDLGVAVSKDLFQDRLVIRIEESFAMGDQSSYAVKSGSQYIPDITSTYKLSKDGRFQLKAYNKNEYDAVVQGYFTEVGINFTIELSYDKFRELVRRRKSQVNDNK